MNNRNRYLTTDMTEATTITINDRKRKYETTVSSSSSNDENATNSSTMCNITNPGRAATVNELVPITSSISGCNNTSSSGSYSNARRRKVTESIWIREANIGFVIGKNGETIKQIRKDSGGAAIHINKDMYFDIDKREASVTGTEDKVKMAIKLIMNVLQSLNQVRSRPTLTSSLSQTQHQQTEPHHNTVIRIQDCYPPASQLGYHYEPYASIHHLSPPAYQIVPQYHIVAPIQHVSSPSYQIVPHHHIVARSQHVSPPAPQLAYYHETDARIQHRPPPAPQLRYFYP